MYYMERIKHIEVTIPLDRKAVLIQEAKRRCDLRPVSWAHNIPGNSRKFWENHALGLFAEEAVAWLLGQKVDLTFHGAGGDKGIDFTIPSSNETIDVKFTHCINYLGVIIPVMRRDRPPKYFHKVRSDILFFTYGPCLSSGSGCLCHTMLHSDMEPVIILGEWMHRSTWIENMVHDPINNYYWCDKKHLWDIQQFIEHYDTVQRALLDTHKDWEDGPLFWQEDYYENDHGVRGVFIEAPCEMEGGALV